MTTLDGKAEAARRIQRRQYAKECLVVCDWMYPVIDNPRGEDHVGDPTFESRILSAATGRRWTEEELCRVGERVFNLQRAVMLREGHRARRDDVLPGEWHEEPLEGHVADPDCVAPGPRGEAVSRIGARLDRPAFTRLRDEYYELVGWDVSTGLPSAARLRELDLPEVAEALGAAGLARPRARRLPATGRLIRRARSALRPVLYAARRGRAARKTVPEEAAEPLNGEELARLMDEQRRMFGDERVAHNFADWNKTMQYSFSDTGEHWLIRFVDGRASAPERLDGPAERPDIVYEMSTATLAAMTRGELSGMQAYRQRRLRLRASFSDMMKLQALNKV